MAITDGELTNGLCRNEGALFNVYMLNSTKDEEYAAKKKAKVII